MRYHPLPVPPPLSLSTRASALLRLPTLFKIGTEAGAEGIDLDWSGRTGRPSPDRIATLAETTGLPVQSVWIPRVAGGPWEGRRRERAVRFAVEVARATFASTLIVDVEPAGGACFPRSGLARVADSLREGVGNDVRVAVALRADQLQRGRGHLAQITMLRRLVEEWELDLALDLLGPVDPRWEVEAAVSRLLPRLAVVRLGHLPLNGPPRGRERLDARVLTTLLDAGFGGTLAVVPPVAAWQAGWASPLMRACAAAGDHVRLRHAAMYEQPAFDSSPDPRLRY